MVLEAIRILALGLSLWFVFTILVGFYKPWVVLWWASFQNRKKILKIYGSLAIVFYLIYLLMEFIASS